MSEDETLKVALEAAAALVEIARAQDRNLTLHGRRGDGTSAFCVVASVDPETIELLNAITGGDEVAE